MSDDGPARGTRLSDKYKRRPLHKMDDRCQEEDKMDDSLDSHDGRSPSRSPKRNRHQVTPGSPGSARRKPGGLYPDLSGLTNDSDQNTASDTSLNRTDSSTNVNDLDISGAKSPENQSPKKRAGRRNNAQKQDANTDEDKHKEDFKTQKADTDSSNHIYVFSGLVLFVLIVATLVLVNSPGEPSSSGYQTSAPAPIDYFRIFKPDFEKIKARYPSQSTRFWKTISAQIKRVMNDPEPTYPAIVIIGAPKGQSEMATCFSKDIIKNVNSVFSANYDIYINSADLVPTSPAKAKLDLDNKLKDILSNGSRGVVLDHIEHLHAETALLLHGYCDGDNAPYKNAVLILVLQTDMTPSELTDRSVDGILTELWGPGLGVDEIPALISRVANNAAILNPEEGNTCET